MVEKVKKTKPTLRSQAQTIAELQSELASLRTVANDEYRSNRDDALVLRSRIAELERQSREAAVNNRRTMDLFRAQAQLDVQQAQQTVKDAVMRALTVKYTPGQGTSEPDPRNARQAEGLIDALTRILPDLPPLPPEIRTLFGL